MNFFSLLQVFSFSCYAVTGATSFDTETLAFSSFKFLGDADVFNGSLRLSRDILSPNSGAGGILYREAIRFRRSAGRIPVSFSTRFILSINNSNKDCPGGGAAFVITPDDDAIGRSGGNLGVPSGAVAVEFDTQMDVEFKDINANHIGFNLDSMISYKAVNLDLFKVDLKSGRPLKVWIDFSGVTGRLKIYITYRDTKPNLPVLSASLNMSRYVNDYMYVGSPPRLKVTRRATRLKVGPSTLRLLMLAPVQRIHHTQINKPNGDMICLPSRRLYGQWWGHWWSPVWVWVWGTVFASI